MDPLSINPFCEGVDMHYANKDKTWDWWSRITVEVLLIGTVVGGLIFLIVGMSNKKVTPPGNIASYDSFDINWRGIGRHDAGLVDVILKDDAMSHSATYLMAINVAFGQVQETHRIVAINPSTECVPRNQILLMVQPR